MIGKVTDWVAVIVSAAILAAVGYGIWCDAVDGKYFNPVLEFGARSTPVTHKTVEDYYLPGQMVTARVLFQKNRNLMGTITWQLVNKKVTAFMPRQVTLPAGVWDKEVNIERLPEDTLPGEHWFCGVVKYNVNWLGKVEYPVWTNRFSVLPLPAKKTVKP